jgi:hypothetical protein
MFSVRDCLKHYLYSSYMPTTFRHSIHTCLKDYRASKHLHWGSIDRQSVLCHLPTSYRNGCYKPTQNIVISTLAWRAYRVGRDLILGRDLPVARFLAGRRDTTNTTSDRNSRSLYYSLIILCRLTLIHVLFLGSSVSASFVLPNLLGYRLLNLSLSVSSIQPVRFLRTVRSSGSRRPA